MRSFAFVLISAALATLISALPLHVNQLRQLQLPKLNEVGQLGSGHVARDVHVDTPDLPQGRRSTGSPIAGMPSDGLSSANPATGGQLGSTEGQLENMVKGQTASGIENPTDAHGSVGSGAGNLQTRDQPSLDKMPSTDPSSVVPSSVKDTVAAVAPATPKRDSLLPVGGSNTNNAVSGLSTPRLSGDGASFNENAS